MSLTIEQQILIEQRITNEGKSLVAGFLFWWLFGIFGGHRFYLGKTGTAVTMLICTFTLIGFFVTLTWMIVDIFLMPDMIREYNRNLRQRYADEMLKLANTGGAAPANPSVSASAAINPVQK